MEWKAHDYRVGSSNETFDDIPTDADELDQFVALHRRRIEPWLSAVFQAEHLNLLLGSGFTTSVAFAAGVAATGMDVAAGTSAHAKAIMDHYYWHRRGQPRMRAGLRNDDGRTRRHQLTVRAGEHASRRAGEAVRRLGHETE